MYKRTLANIGPTPPPINAEEISKILTEGTSPRTARPIPPPMQAVRHKMMTLVGARKKAMKMARNLNKLSYKVIYS